MSSPPLTTLLEGLRFPEAPRWHQGRLWFLDFFRQEVMADNALGEMEVQFHLAESPSGLGWRPDGTLLVVSMHDERLLAWCGADSGVPQTVADLSAHADGPCNDMVVDAQGGDPEQHCASERRKKCPRR